MELPASYVFQKSLWGLFSLKGYLVAMVLLILGTTWFGTRVPEADKRTNKKYKHDKFHLAWSGSWLLYSSGYQRSHPADCNLHHHSTHRYSYDLWHRSVWTCGCRSQKAKHLQSIDISDFYQFRRWWPNRQHSHHHQVLDWTFWTHCRQSSRHSQTFLLHFHLDQCHWYHDL